MAYSRKPPFMSRDAGVFQATTYGVTADGVTDDFAALQSTINAAVAFITTAGKGAVVQLPPGIILLATGSPTPPVGYSRVGVSLPVNLLSELTIRGVASDTTTVKLSDNARCAFWINKQADYDSFQHVTFEDFSINGGAAVGQSHLLIGNVPGVSTPQRYLNFKHIRVRRMSCSNVPFDAVGLTTDKAFVHFFGIQDTPGEVTQTSSIDILCEDLQMDDVQSGILIKGNTAHVSNHYYNDIRLLRCNHEQSNVPATTLPQTSFYICGSGKGDYFEIIDCYSGNIGDDAVEIGAMQTGVIERLRTKDTFLVSILFRLSQALPDAQSQYISIRDCEFDITAAPFAVGGLAGFAGKPIGWIVDDPTFNFGSFHLERCFHTVKSAVWSQLGRSANGDLGFRVSGTIRKVVMDDCGVRYEAFNFDATGTQDAAFLLPNLLPGIPLVNGAGTANAAIFVANDFEVIYEDGTQTGGGALVVQCVEPQGVRGHYVINGLSAAFINSTTNARCLARVGVVGNPESIRLRRLTGLGIGGASGVIRGVQLKATASYGALYIEDSDFRQWTSGGASDIDYSGGSVGNIAATIERNNLYANKVITVSENGQLGLFAPTPSNLWTPGTRSQAANRGWFSRRYMRDRPFAVVSISFDVTTAAGSDDSCDVGILNSDMSVVLAHSGATSGKLNSLGLKTIPVVWVMQPYTVYYVAIAYGAAGSTLATLLAANFANTDALSLFGVANGTIEGGYKDAAYPLAAPVVLANTALSNAIPLLILNGSQP